MKTFVPGQTSQFGNTMAKTLNNIMLEKEVTPLLIDAKTAAKLLNLSERTLRTLTKRGELPVVKLMRRVLYSHEELVEFVRQRSQRTSQEIR